MYVNELYVPLTDEMALQVEERCNAADSRVVHGEREGGGGADCRNMIVWYVVQYSYLGNTQLAVSRVMRMSCQGVSGRPKVAIRCI